MNGSISTLKKPALDENKKNAKIEKNFQKSFATQLSLNFSFCFLLLQKWVEKTTPKVKLKLKFLRIAPHTCSLELQNILSHCKVFCLSVCQRVNVIIPNSPSQAISTHFNINENIIESIFYSSAVVACAKREQLLVLMIIWIVWIMLSSPYL